MKRTENLRVEGFEPLVTPKQLKHAVPQSDAAAETVCRARGEIADILERKDPRRLVVVGPCSIHDSEAALDYARRLKALGDELSDRLLLVMRVYFEKPRTSVGWKGLINDPHLDGSFDMREGLRKARALLADVIGLGLPTATEVLDPITPHYLADFICWGAIGARTTESQIHRELASGLSFPVGFKNGTNGDLQVAVDALRSSRAAHRFLGIDEDGLSSMVRTRGNPHVHVVLRGGSSGPNYEADHVRAAVSKLETAGQEPRLMIDCSHANSGKDPERQAVVLDDVLGQIAAGEDAIFGLMMESNLEGGRQSIPADGAEPAYGVSVTDACLDWASTERLLRGAWDVLGCG